MTDNVIYDLLVILAAGLIAGDAADEQTLKRGHVQRATLAIVCVPDDSVSLAVVRLVHRINANYKIMVTSNRMSLA